MCLVSDLNLKFLSWTEPDIDRKINRTPEPDISTGQYFKNIKKKSILQNGWLLGIQLYVNYNGLLNSKTYSFHNGQVNQ